MIKPLLPNKFWGAPPSGGSWVDQRYFPVVPHRFHGRKCSNVATEGPNLRYGMFRGGLMTKIYPLIDCRGRPIRLHSSKGQASDCKQAEPLLALIPRDSTFLADSDAKRRQVAPFFSGRHTPQAQSRAKFRCRPVPLPLSQTDRALVRKLKYTSCLAVSCDKRADNFPAAAKLFSAGPAINAYVSTDQGDRRL